MVCVALTVAGCTSSAPKPVASQAATASPTPSPSEDSKAADAWLGKLAKPVTFPIAYDVDSKVSKLYKVETMPSTVIVDRKGNVRALHRGYKAGDENFYLTQIRTMLKE